MGIRYLQTFLCNDVPDGYFQINIGQEIQRWQSQNCGRAVIVFDVMALLNITLQSNIDVVQGGRHHIVLSKYEDFFRKLKQNHQAELVFFCDGRVQQNKNDIWIERQNEKYAKTIRIFDKIEESNGSLKFINTLKSEDFPGLTTTIHGLVNVCRKHGEFKLAMNVECDTELSRFATLNNAVAVIADDTDFLIYEGNWKYWSARNLNLVQFTTMEYCRSALRIALGLAPKQLPIFATLAGNDIIRQDHVQPFHRRLRLNRHNRFDKLAQFVRSNKTDVANISQAIFGSTKDQFVNLVQESVGTYNINYETTVVHDLLTQKSAYETSFYTFLNGLPYNITLMFSDLRRRDFLSYYEILMPIVKRQIGFVRQHKNSKDYRQVIVTKIDHNQSYKEFLIAPDYPKLELPSLLDITFDKKTEHLNSLRFDLLAWLIFGGDQVLNIEELPANYMVLMTTLKFLLNINQITITEADAVLLCVHKVHQKTVPVDMSSPAKVTTRSIMVSHLYSRMHNTILICFKFVGLDRLIDYLLFDGPFFMVLVERLSSQSETDYNHTIADILQFRKFLFD
ncbi:uncharacterized protein LOC119073234 [Bradysia coprophila]|uniref:uncharacterized protein LOC119073234 n=1 Tax=Bradysia coprophila TaxID=38358 RepID=UPI00187D9DD0|nr:uncharacterized protein LOC119073234 [Bradysia coprophila]XP_037034445.1 uncharacterized protein LOC119073234 [Bradysia coprophila]